MAIDEQKYERLKARADRARQDRDKAAGQLESAQARLWDEFECSTLEEAEVLQKDLAKKAKKAETSYNKAVEKFEGEWEDYVQD